MGRWAEACLALVVVLAGVACGDDGGGGGSSADVGIDDSGDVSGGDSDVAEAEDVPGAEGPNPIVMLEAARSDPTYFFDHPWPSDLRLTGNGAPDLSKFPVASDVPIVPAVLAAIGRDNRGFSPATAIYFRFDAPLDEASLPLGALLTLRDDASVYVVNVDARSPTYGQRVPVVVGFTTEPGVYWAGEVLYARPLPGYELAPSTTYAAVVTTGARGLDGAPITRSPVITSLLGPEPPASREDVWQVYKPLVETLSAEELQSVAVATVFTTGDPTEPLRRIRRWLHEQPPLVVEPGSWRVVEESTTEDYLVLEARYEAVELLSGAPPFEEAGQGLIRFDEEGVPLVGGIFARTFTLGIPTGPVPADGWPVTLFGHPADSRHGRLALRNGPDVGLAGSAMIGIDLPMHGERNPNQQPFDDYLLSLAATNIVAGRDLFRHGVVDYLQLIRLISSEDFAVPSDIVGGQSAVRFATDDLLWFSHDLGSAVGAMLLAIEPQIHSAFLSAAGGGAAVAFLDRPGAEIANLVALLIGVDIEQEPLTAEHPVVNILLQPLLDPADPINYAPHALRRSDGVTGPVHLIMTEGLNDDVTRPDTTEALGAAFGVPIAEPVRADSLPHRAWMLEAVPLPATGNVETPYGPVTGALVQFSDGHNTYFNEDARLILDRWVRTSIGGQTPTIDLRAD